MRIDEIDRKIEDRFGMPVADIAYTAETTNLLPDWVPYNITHLRTLVRNGALEEMSGEFNEAISIVMKITLAVGDVMLKEPTRPITPNSPLRNSIIDIHSNGETYATADTDLFFTPWSKSFVHGSDSLVAVTALVENILQDGETITELQKVTWRKPMKTNMSLVVLEDTPGALENPDQYTLEVKVVTSNGRVLQALGIDNPNSPIKHREGYNAYAERCICTCQDCSIINHEGDDVHVAFSLNEPLVPTCYEDFAASPPTKASTMMELLTYAISYAGQGKRGGDDSVLKVIGGVRNLEIPNDMEDIFQPGSKLQIQILNSKAKPGKSGMTIVPFKFKFPNQENWGSGIVAVTTSHRTASNLVD